MKLRRTANGSLPAALAVSAIVVASAMAQGDRGDRDPPSATDLSATMQVTPSKAGTSEDPRGVAIDATSTIETERGSEPPIVTGLDLAVGPGFSWNGDRYVTCRRRVLDRRGPRGCPRESIMGSGVAGARAGGVDTGLDMTFVNGGTGRLLAFIRFEYPARVQETIVVKGAELPGTWGYKYTLRVPASLQVVAGIPVQTTSLRFQVGGKPYARDYVATTSCPRGGWRYRITAHYRYDETGQTDQDAVGGAIACTS